MKNTLNANMPAKGGLKINFLYALTCALYLLAQIIPSKDTLKRLAKYALGFSIAVVAAIALMLLLIRAIDVELESQEMVLEQHKKFLQIELPHDAK